MGTEVIVMGAKGRMGSTIARLAQEDPNFTLAGVVEKPGNEAGLEEWGCEHGTDLSVLCKAAPDAVVIDFTSPESTMAAAEKCVQHRHPLVAGTTGLTAEQQAELETLAKNTAIFWAPNMSVGVNALVKVLPRLVRQLGLDYDLEMVEIHHGKKKDAPSGTALKLAQTLADARDWDLDKVGCYERKGIIGERTREEIGVQTIRGGDVAGVHTVFFLGPGERIEITHHAHSRETFARGALRAAGWIGKQLPTQLYTMADML
jgi:4-hydroxy-tetrahydrodipicolinate reductase